MTKTRNVLSHVTSLALAVLIAPAGCAIEDGGASVGGADELDEQGRATGASRYDHASLLAPANAVASEPSEEFLAEIERLPVSYDLSKLPVIYDESGELRVAPMAAVPVESDKAGSGEKINPRLRSSFVVGGEDLVTYFFIEIPLPSSMTDFDGGTIRLIMQHEIDGLDQIRVIDENIATEFVDNSFGARGRFPGRYGWTRQSGGGEWSWILGDGTPHNMATPWDWSWVLDYRWLQGNTVLPGDTIRIYSHPHVTTRVAFLD